MTSSLWPTELSTLSSCWQTHHPMTACPPQRGLRPPRTLLPPSQAPGPRIKGSRVKARTGQHAQKEKGASLPTSARLHYNYLTSQGLHLLTC